jgi:FkbM family methyltransferase
VSTKEQDVNIDPSTVDGVNQHETSFLYDEIFVQGVYLPDGFVLPPGAVVFDVGANIGMYSLFAHSACATASVYAFEPLPPLVAKLRTNLAAHGVRATVLPYGLSDTERSVDFTYYPGYSTMSVQHDYADTLNEKTFVKSLLSSVDDNEEVALHLDELLDFQFREQSFSCRVSRFSDVVDEHRVDRVDMLKIDVQRAEVDVLRGVDDRHWPIIRQIAVEVHDEPSTSTAGRLPQVERQLRERGFVVIVREQDLEAANGRYTLYGTRYGSQSANTRPANRG